MNKKSYHTVQYFYRWRWFTKMNQKQSLLIHLRKVFLEISQNSQENTCVRVVSFLIKLQALACNFIKKETLKQVFSCQFCEISESIFSYRTPPVAASDECYRLYWDIRGSFEISQLFVQIFIETELHLSYQKLQMSTDVYLNICKMQWKGLHKLYRKTIWNIWHNKSTDKSIKCFLSFLQYFDKWHTCHFCALKY